MALLSSRPPTKRSRTGLSSPHCPSGWPIKLLSACCSCGSAPDALRPEAKSGLAFTPRLREAGTKAANTIESASRAEAGTPPNSEAALLLRSQATVDDQCRSGHEACIIRGQKQDAERDILG
jgi:hypothetical protein